MKSTFAARVLFVLAALPMLPVRGAHAVTTAGSTPGSVASASAAVPFVVQTDVSVRRFYGYARSLASGKYVYTEVHAQYWQAGQWIGGTVRYFAPDGASIAQKVLDFPRASPRGSSVPLYRLDQKNVHYAEGVSRVTPSAVYLFRQEAGATSPKQTAVDYQADMAAGIAGLEHLLSSRLPELLKTGSMVFPLVSARHLGVSRVNVTRLKDGSVRGIAAVRFKVEPASVLHVFYGTPMFLSLDPATGRVLEYRGPAEIENPKTGKRYRVRIDYGGDPPAGAPAKLPPLDLDDAG